LIVAYTFENGKLYEGNEKAEYMKVEDDERYAKIRDALYEEWDVDLDWMGDVEEWLED
jgi:hypothetical protein